MVCIQLLVQPSISKVGMSFAKGIIIMNTLSRLRLS